MHTPAPHLGHPEHQRIQLKGLQQVGQHCPGRVAFLALLALHLSARAAVPGALAAPPERRQDAWVGSQPGGHPSARVQPGGSAAVLAAAARYKAGVGVQSLLKQRQCGDSALAPPRTRACRAQSLPRGRAAPARAVARGAPAARGGLRPLRRPQPPLGAARGAGGRVARLPVATRRRTRAAPPGLRAQTRAFACGGAAGRAVALGCGAPLKARRSPSSASSAWATSSSVGCSSSLTKRSASANVCAASRAHAAAGEASASRSSPAIAAAAASSVRLRPALNQAMRACSGPSRHRASNQTRVWRRAAQTSKNANSRTTAQTRPGGSVQVEAERRRPTPRTQTSPSTANRPARRRRRRRRHPSPLSVPLFPSPS